LLAPDGAVVLSRLRGTRRLTAGERLDARHLLESLSEIFLAPAIRGPASLIRMLVSSRTSWGLAGRSVDEALAALEVVRAEHAVPMGRGAIAELCDAGLWRPYNQDSTAI